MFLNSHLLSEVEITCDRVAFIKRGQVLETRPIQTWIDGETTVSLRARKLDAQIISGLAQWGAVIRTEPERLSLTIGSSDLIPDLLRYLVKSGVDVYEVTPQRFSLEERFLQVVGEDGGL